MQAHESQLQPIQALYVPFFQFLLYDTNDTDYLRLVMISYIHLYIYMFTCLGGPSLRVA
jgi:hypothetical protein